MNDLVTSASVARSGKSEGRITCWPRWWLSRGQLSQTRRTHVARSAGWAPGRNGERRCLEAGRTRAWWVYGVGAGGKRYSTHDEAWAERRMVSLPAGILPGNACRCCRPWRFIDEHFKSASRLRSLPSSVAVRLACMPSPARRIAPRRSEPVKSPERTARVRASWRGSYSVLRRAPSRRIHRLKRHSPLRGWGTRVFADSLPARTGLWIFSAGDDAMPLLQLSQRRWAGTRRLPTAFAPLPRASDSRQTTWWCCPLAICRKLLRGICLCGPRMPRW